MVDLALRSFRNGYAVRPEFALCGAFYPRNERAHDFPTGLSKTLKKRGPAGVTGRPALWENHGKEGRAGPAHGPPWRKAKFMQGEMEGFKEESGQDVLR